MATSELVAPGEVAIVRSRRTGSSENLARLLGNATEEQLAAFREAFQAAKANDPIIDLEAVLVTAGLLDKS